MSKIGWDSQLEGGLPDCRLSQRRDKTVVHNTVRLGRMIMERVFCANCGCDGGLVTADWSPHVFYICEECFLVHGGVGLPQIPDADVRGL